MLHNSNLSLKAKGLGAVLESYSDDFDVSLKSIELKSTDGQKALKSAIKELENGYYLYRFQTRDEQGLFETYWAFDSQKLDIEYLKNVIKELEKVEIITQNNLLQPGYQKGTPDNVTTGMPLSGGRSMGARQRTTYNNKEYNNKEYKNTLFSREELSLKILKQFIFSKIQMDIFCQKFLLGLKVR